VLNGCASGQVTSDPIANPSFESWGELPAAWNLDAKVRSKGAIAQNHSLATDGATALQLSPNKNNTPSDSPFGVGQLVDLAPYGGSTMSVRAALGATGSATAVLGAFAIDGQGQIVVGQQLRQSAGLDELSIQRTSLDIPTNANGMKLIVFCVVEGTSGHAYFDDIKVALANAQGSTPVASNPLEASIQIDISKTVRVLPRSLFGANLEWAFNANDLWNPDAKQLRPEALRLIDEGGVALIRFPGGVLSDAYHWKDGIGNPATRRSTKHYPRGPESRHVVGTDEILQLARTIDANLLFTVNAGTGTAQEAADWVRYVERSDDNRVAFWEIGNELYMRDDMSGASMSPADYAKKVRSFSTAMRAVDPSIKIGAIGGLNYGRYSFISYPDWTKTVLRQTGNDIDFIAVHNAYAPVLINAENEKPANVYSALLAAPILVGRNLDALTDLIRKEAPDSADRMEIAITEWGPFFHVSPGSSWVDHVKTLGSALFVADTLRVFAERPKVTIATFFKLMEPTFMGWLGPRDGKYIPKPAFLAFELYTQHCFPQVLATQVSSPTYDSPGAGVVDAVRDVPYLTALAAKDPNTARISVIVVNKHPTADITTDISASGIGAFSTGTRWTLTGKSLDSHTGTQLQKIPGLTWAEQKSMAGQGSFNASDKANVEVVEDSFIVQAPVAHITFPAHSVTAVELLYD
jgi:alpha-N-arabinofuranosidase